MSIILDSMIDHVVRKFGHESKEAIRMCEVAEGQDFQLILDTFKSLMGKENLKK